MHEEDEMRKGTLSSGMSLFVIIIDAVDFDSSGSCCELLACFTVGIAVCGSWPKCVECLERVYIPGSFDRRSALILFCAGQKSSRLRVRWRSGFGLLAIKLTL